MSDVFVVEDATVNIDRTVSALILCYFCEDDVALLPVCLFRIVYLKRQCVTGYHTSAIE